MKKLFVLLICLAILSPAYAKQNKKQKKLPPGLAKKVERGGELPPGWQKKLVKGEVLDSELYEKAKPLSEKEKKKFPYSAGTELLKIKNKIIRVIDSTRTILDVFEVGK